MNNLYRNLILKPSLGIGVFAGKDFRIGELVEIAPCLYDDGSKGNGFEDYVFAANDENGSVLALGYGSLYNHSDNPNLDYEQKNRFMMYTANCPIYKDEELTISYGSDWWHSRPSLLKKRVQVPPTYTGPRPYYKNTP